MTTEGTFDLEQQRDQLTHYVATADHPWDSTETVRLFELAVRVDVREKIARDLERLVAGLANTPDEHGHASMARKTIEVCLGLVTHRPDAP